MNLSTPVQLQRSKAKTNNKKKLHIFSTSFNNSTTVQYDPLKYLMKRDKKLLNKINWCLTSSYKKYTSDENKLQNNKKKKQATSALKNTSLTNKKITQPAEEVNTIVQNTDKTIGTKRTKNKRTSTKELVVLIHKYNRFVANESKGSENHLKNQAVDQLIESNEDSNSNNNKQGLMPPPKCKAIKRTIPIRHCTPKALSKKSSNIGKLNEKNNLSVKGNVSQKIQSDELGSAESMQIGDKPKITATRYSDRIKFRTSLDKKQLQREEDVSLSCSKMENNTNPGSKCRNVENIAALNKSSSLNQTYLSDDINETLFSSFLNSSLYKIMVTEIKQDSNNYANIKNSTAKCFKDGPSLVIEIDGKAPCKNYSMKNCSTMKKKRTFNSDKQLDKSDNSRCNKKQKTKNNCIDNQCRNDELLNCVTELGKIIESNFSKSDPLSEAIHKQWSEIDKHLAKLKMDHQTVESGNISKKSVIANKNKNNETVRSTKRTSSKLRESKDIESVKSAKTTKNIPSKHSKVSKKLVQKMNEKDVLLKTVCNKISDAPLSQHSKGKGKKKHFDGLEIPDCCKVDRNQTTCKTDPAMTVDVDKCTNACITPNNRSCSPDKPDMSQTSSSMSRRTSRKFFDLTEWMSSPAYESINSDE